MGKMNYYVAATAEDGKQGLSPEQKKIFNEKISDISKAKTLSELASRVISLRSFAQGTGDPDAIKIAERIFGFYNGQTKGIEGKSAQEKEKILAQVKNFAAQIDNPFYQTVEEEQPAAGAAGSASSSKKSESDYAKEMRRFAVDLASRVLYFTGPQAAYGIGMGADEPAWAELVRNDYGKLSGHYGKQFEAQFKEALGQTAKDIGSYEKGLLLALASAKNNEEFNGALRQITSIQRTMDAISLAIEYRQMGALVDGATEAGHEKSFRERLSKLVPDASWDEIAEYVKIMKGRNPSGAIKWLLWQRQGEGRMSGLEQRMAALVIDANYGENAKALEFLINDMNGNYIDARTPENTIKNLESFYGALLGPMGLGSAKYKDAWTALSGIEIGGRLFTAAFPQGLLFSIEIPENFGSIESLEIKDGNVSITLSIDEQTSLQAEGSSLTKGAYTIENKNGKLNVYLAGTVPAGNITITNGSISISLTQDDLESLKIDGNSVTKGNYLVKSVNGMLEVSRAGKTTLASVLLNEKQYIPDNMSGVERNRYDVAVLAGFMYQHGNGEYFKSATFRDPSHSTRFLGAITGVGGASLPLPVTLTMLENTKTLDFLYKNFSFDPDGLLSIVNTAVSNLANKIYAQPFGAEFRKVNPEDALPTTKYEAGALLVQKIPTLQANWMLDDLISKLTDLNYHEDEAYIKIKAIWQIIQMYPQYFDTDDVGQFMNALNIRPSEWNNPWQAYQNIDEYVRNNPRVYIAEIEKINAIIQRLPRVYIDGIDRLGDRIVKRSLYSVPTEMSGTGNFTGMHDADPANVYKHDRTNLYGSANASTTTGGANLFVAHTGDTEQSYDKIDSYSTWNVQNSTMNAYTGQVIVKDQLLSIIETGVKNKDLTMEHVTMSEDVLTQTNAVLGNADVYLYFDKNAYNSINTQFGEKKFTSDLLTVATIPEFLAKMQAVDPAITALGIDIESQLLKLSTNGESCEFTLNNKAYIAYVKEGKINLYQKYETPLESGTESRRMHYEALVRLNGQYFKVGGLDKLMRKNDEAGKTIGQYVSAQQVYFEWEKGQKVWSENPDKAGIGLFAAGEYQNREIWFNTQNASADLQAKGIELTPEQQDAIAALKPDETLTVSGNGRRYEVMMKSDGTQDVLLAPSKRFGFALGVENTAWRLAALGVETVDGGGLAAGSFENRKARDSGMTSGILISAGCFTYGPDQTNLIGEQSWSTSALNQTVNQIGAAVQRDVSNEAFGFASYTLINRLYGIVIGNPNLAAGKFVGQDLEKSSFGLNGLVKWGGDGARVYMFDGQYQYSDWIKVQVFGQHQEKVEAEEQKQQDWNAISRTGGRATTYFGKKKRWGIYLYGVDNSLLHRPFYRKYNLTFEQLRTQAFELRNEIDEYTSGTNPSKDWEITTGMNILLRNFARRQMDIFNQISMIQTGNALGLVENQYSVGFIDKKTGDVIKVSLARVRIEKTDNEPALFENSDALYLSSLTSWNLSRKKEKNKVLSMVVGFPVSYIGDTEQEKEFGRKYAVQNYAGAKYTINDLAFGVTWYNLGSPSGNPTAMKMSVGWVNPKFTAGGNVMLFEGGGHAEDFTVGNQKVVIGTVTHANVAGNREVSLAMTRAFALSAAQTTINRATIYGRRSTTGGLRTFELGGAYERQHSNKLFLRAEVGLVDMKMPGKVKSWDWYVNVGLVYKINYPSTK